MKKVLFLALIINQVFINQISYGQDSPKAIISGRTSVATPNQSVMIRSEGSVGKALKFSMSPKVNQAFSFKDSETGELVFLYIPEANGVYSVALAASSGDGSKVDIAIIQTTVGGGIPTPPGPNPPNPPGPNPPTPINDPLVKIIQDSVVTDIAAGVGTAVQQKNLSDIFRNAAKTTVFNVAMKKPQDIYNVMHAAAASPQGGNIPDGQLPGLRKALSDYQNNYFKFPPGKLLDDATRLSMSTMFIKIADALIAPPLTSINIINNNRNNRNEHNKNIEKLISNQLKMEGV